MGVCRMIPRFGRQSDKWQELSEGTDQAHGPPEAYSRVKAPGPVVTLALLVKIPPARLCKAPLAFPAGCTKATCF